MIQEIKNLLPNLSKFIDFQNNLGYKIIFHKRLIKN